MKRTIALILIFIMAFASVHTFAAVENERGYAFADDSAAITTNISTEGDIATLDVYVSGGIYGFTGLSFGYEYDASALTLLNNDGTPAEEASKDFINRTIQKIDLRMGWIENVSCKPGQVRYFIASTNEFVSYRTGESEKLFSIKFKINTPDGENSIKYLADANVITCGDVNIYQSPKKITEKILDGSNIFKLEKNFAPKKIEITDKSYSDVNKIYMTVGETRPLKVKSQMPSEFLWGSTGDVATVDENGVVTALAPGETNVTAFDFFGNSDSIKIVVQESNVRPSEMKIVCPDTVMVGDMIRPVCEISPAEVPSTAIIWSVEGENAAILTDDPVLWALSEGEVLVRASLEANVSFYAEKTIRIIPAPKSSVKVTDGSFLVPEKLYAKPNGETVFDITPKLFNVAGAPVAKEAYSEFYDIEYTLQETKGITFENGILTIAEDAPAVTEMSISAVVKYKVDGKEVMTLKSNKFSVLNSKLKDVRIEGAEIFAADFGTGIYEVASADFEIMPVADGQVYSVEIKKGNVTDVYFFSADKKGILGYNFNYMIKHISVQVVK